MAWSKKEEGLYSDQIISASELNRRPGWVLERVALGPVTITRNDEAFALVPRQQMARLVSDVRQFRLLVAIQNAIMALLSDRDLPADHIYSWLQVFGKTDLYELAEELVESLSSADIDFEGSWVGEIIHEWHETALAILDPVHREAFESLKTHDEVDEVPLGSLEVD